MGRCKTFSSLLWVDKSLKSKIMNYKDSLEANNRAISKPNTDLSDDELKKYVDGYLQWLNEEAQEFELLVAIKAAENFVDVINEVTDDLIDRKKDLNELD